jgi:hypothetical protein
MAKIITREELAKKILAAVRQHPGCESVKEVAVTKVDILDQGSTWHVNLVDQDDARSESATRALREVHDQLISHYHLP